MLPVSLDCPFLIDCSVFSNDYLIRLSSNKNEPPNNKNEPPNNKNEPPNYKNEPSNNKNEPPNK